YLSGSGKLRWSYGGIRGRESDWQRQWAASIDTRAVEGLAAAGFSALYVDRFGLPDKGLALDRLLNSITGPAVAESDNGRLRWYDLRGVKATLEDRIGAGGVAQVARGVTTVPYVEYRQGWG